jgi:hypothetical protein
MNGAIKQTKHQYLGDQTNEEQITGRENNERQSIRRHLDLSKPIE